MKNPNISIHTSSFVSENAKIGQGTKIWQFCTIMDNVVIGEYCNIGFNVFIENGVVLGNNVKVKNNVSLYQGLHCADDVFLGPSCVFTNVLTPRSFIERKKEFLNTYIGKGATIGANATIVCGHKIGKYAMIGAGSVVTKDIDDYVLVIGNPAEKFGHVCKCGEKLIFQNDLAFCKRCEKKYKKTQDKVKEII